MLGGVKKEKGSPVNRGVNRVVSYLLNNESEKKTDLTTQSQF